MEFLGRLWCPPQRNGDQASIHHSGGPSGIKLAERALEINDAYGLFSSAHSDAVSLHCHYPTVTTSGQKYVAGHVLPYSVSDYNYIETGVLNTIEHVHVTKRFSP